VSIITDGAAAQVIPTTPIADLARDYEAYKKSLVNKDGRNWNHLEFHQQQDEVAAMFADLNGWYLSNEAFVPFDIADDSFKLDEITKLNAYNLRYISYRCMDHKICFKAHRPEWETARCIAIAAQPYGNIDRHRRELDEVAKRYGLRWHVAPNPHASIWSPGRALFIVLTLPNIKVNWLPEQQIPAASAQARKDNATSSEQSTQARKDNTTSKQALKPVQPPFTITAALRLPARDIDPAIHLAPRQAPATGRS